jgi:hypothetical protein
MSTQTAAELHNRQLELENDAMSRGIARMYGNMIANQGSSAEVPKDGAEGDGKFKRSFIYQIINKDLKRFADKIEAKRKDIGPNTAWIFKILENCGTSTNIAAITIKTMFERLSSISDYENDSISMVSIGHAVGQSCLLLHPEGANEDEAHPLDRATISPVPQRAQKKAHPLGEDLTWDAIGIALVQLYLETSRYFERASLASFQKRTKKPKSPQKSVKLKSPQEIIANRIKDDSIPPIWSPLLLPPKPWTSLRDGGYHGVLSGKAAMVTKRKAISGLSPEKCPEVFNAVNALQNTPFRICKIVYSVFSKLLFPTDGDKMKNIYEAANSASSSNRYAKLFDLQATNSGNRDKTYETIKNNRFAALKNLHDEATRFLKDDFYFLNYCDFRGRVYQKSDVLNPQGDDLFRNILEFAEGKKVSGENAAKYLAARQ